MVRRSMRLDFDVVSRLSSLVSRLSSLVSRLSSLVSRLSSLVSRLSSYLERIASATQLVPGTVRQHGIQAAQVQQRVLAAGIGHVITGLVEQRLVLESGRGSHNPPARAEQVGEVEDVERNLE